MQHPDAGHRARTTLGALVPKGRPKKIQSLKYMLRLPGLLARVYSALASSTGPVGTLPPSALTLSGEREVRDPRTEEKGQQTQLWLDLVLLSLG